MKKTGNIPLYWFVFIIFSDRFPIVTVVVSVHKTTFDDQTIHPVGCSVKIKYRSRKRLMERRVALVTGGNS